MKTYIEKTHCDWCNKSGFFEEFYTFKIPLCDIDVRGGKDNSVIVSREEELTLSEVDLCKNCADELCEYFLAKKLFLNLKNS